MIALLEARRAGLLTRAHLMPNLIAGLVVGIVAMPLAMAFAIASGATPAQGLYTAIVAGLVTATFGGTRVQISGPTGAFIAVLASITAQFGIAGLQAATVMAGFILLVMGLARLGNVIKFIPSPVIAGFTVGIAVIISATVYAEQRSRARPVEEDADVPPPPRQTGYIVRAWLRRDKV